MIGSWITLIGGPFGLLDRGSFEPL